MEEEASQAKPTVEERMGGWERRGGGDGSFLYVGDM